MNHIIRKLIQGNSHVFNCKGKVIQGKFMRRRGWLQKELLHESSKIRVCCHVCYCPLWVRSVPSVSEQIKQCYQAEQKYKCCQGNNYVSQIKTPSFRIELACDVYIFVYREVALTKSIFKMSIGSSEITILSLWFFRSIDGERGCVATVRGQSSHFNAFGLANPWSDWLALRPTVELSCANSDEQLTSFIWYHHKNSQILNYFQCQIIS